MKITYWSDYACPYCYIGEARLKKAMASIPELSRVELEMKAFQLDPTAGARATSDTQTRFAHKYGLSYEQAERQIETISQLGRAEGLDFKYATTLFTNTMDAHRLTKLARRSGDAALVDRVVEALFKAYFSDNKELADKTLLQQIGEACGLNPDEVRATLESDRFKDEVILDEREAALYGIHAVPFFIIGKYAIPGAQNVEDMTAALRRALHDENGATIHNGASCGSNGCRLG